MAEQVVVSGHFYPQVTFPSRLTSTIAPEWAERGSMKKQSLRFFTMLLLTVAVAFVAAVASANAQSTDLVRSNIPFDFIVGDQTLPAGEYICRGVMVTSNDAMQIISADGHKSAFRMTHSAESTAKQTKVRLVFHKYGDRYFLAQVWTSGSTGRELFKSKAERAIAREVARNRSKGEVAQNASAPETVTIIASLQ